MARSILSFGMFSARAAMIAARSRGFIAGAGRPILADTVISRASLPNSLDFTASCRPLRCMMFLNCECPAIARFPVLPEHHCEEPTDPARSGRPDDRLRDEAIHPVPKGPGLLR